MTRIQAILPTLALCSLVTVSPSNVAAQEALQLGFRGGVSVSSASLDVSDTFDKSNRTGFAGGMFLDYDFGLLGFQIGAQYSQRGVNLDLGSVVHEFDISYLELPAVLKVGVPAGVVRPSVFGGVAVGFKTGCDNGGTDCSDDIQGTDYAGILGADLAIYLGSASLWADARYHFGLQNIDDGLDLVSDLQNRAWTLQAGIGFGVGD